MKYNVAVNGRTDTRNHKHEDQRSHTDNAKNYFIIIIKRQIAHKISPSTEFTTTFRKNKSEILQYYTQNEKWILIFFMFFNFFPSVKM